MRLTRSLPVLLVAVALMPAPAAAQAGRRGPARSHAVARPPASRPVYRPVPRSSYRTAYRPSYYRPYYGSPYRTHVGLSFGWGGSWGWGLGWGWGYPYSFVGAYGYPYGWYPYGWYPYSWPGYNYEYFVARQNMSAVRIMAKPRQAEVYVDGYYVGLVDDFDGLYQRLRVEAGEHELLLYLDGYRPVRQKLYFTPGATLKVQYVLEPLGPGEAMEPRPQPPARPATQPPAEPPPAARPGVAVEPMARAPSAFGTLSVRVQPADAEILIDGDAWMAPLDQDQLVVQVTEGVHTIVVRKAGYETFSAEVEVRRGETTPVNVSILRRE